MMISFWYQEFVILISKNLQKFNNVCHDLFDNDLTKFLDVSQLLCLTLHSWLRLVIHDVVELEKLSIAVTDYISF